jgi:hypothetical protein
MICRVLVSDISRAGPCHRPQQFQEPATSKSIMYIAVSVVRYLSGGGVCRIS